MLKKQTRKIEEAIEKIKDDKDGRCGKVFKMKEIIAGPKKGGQEAHAIRDPITKELVVGTGEIKRVSLEHCLAVLNKNEPNEEFREIIAMKDFVHDVRMEQTDGSEFEVGKEVYVKVLDNFLKKNKKS